MSIYKITKSILKKKSSDFCHGLLLNIYGYIEDNLAHPGSECLCF